MKTFLSHSPEETENIGQEMARTIQLGQTLALAGELGAGKTSFVRGFVSECRVNADVMVTSPTFTLMHEYPTQKGPVLHFDFYRIQTFEELITLDFEELTQRQDAICLVEWADKFDEIKEDFSHWLFFEVIDENTRRITLLSKGSMQE